jgi:hypothetical protein
MSILERLQKSSFPLAAVLGAFTAFISSAFKTTKETPRKSQANVALVKLNFSPTSPVALSRQFELNYSLALNVGASSSRPFRNSLLGIAVDDGDNLFALGDGEVRIFDPSGKIIRSWKAPEGALCLAVGSGDRICFGRSGHVEIYEASGRSLQSFAAGEPGKPAIITAIKFFGQEILAADAAARIIRRYDSKGQQIGIIGTQGKNQGFMLPNKSLDIAVDAKGVIRATDPGRHLVTAWTMDGKAIGRFGKFGMANPEDFVGCCNPVNLAITTAGNIVTAEKVAARIKVFDSEGKLLALIGPEHFDPQCRHIYLAADSKGRILAADTIRLEIKIFAPKKQRGDRNSL